LHGAELPAHLAAELAELIDDAERYAAAAQAINTTRAYASDWNQFQAWCERYQLASMPAPAAVIALYVTSLARRGLAFSTIRRRAATIARAHRQARPPTRHQRPSRPHRARGDRPRPRLSPEQETALLRDPLLELIDRIDTAPQPGYATARCCCSDSRSACGDPSSSRSQSRTSPPSPDGLRIRIARSKTDQHGRGQELLVRDQNWGVPLNAEPMRR
jgi:hypothetical protein